MRKMIAAVALVMSTPTLAQQSADSASAMARLMEADANRDGQVTRAELIIWRSANFARFDRNHDGLLAPDDIPALLRSSAVGVQLAGMIKHYDGNGDNRLTRAEFTDGPTPLFDLADANHDGLVTRAEVDAATAQMRSARRR